MSVVDPSTGMVDAALSRMPKDVRDALEPRYKQLREMAGDRAFVAGMRWDGSRRAPGPSDRVGEQASAVGDREWDFDRAYAEFKAGVVNIGSGFVKVRSAHLAANDVLGVGLPRPKPTPMCVLCAAEWEAVGDRSQVPVESVRSQRCRWHNDFRRKADRDATREETRDHLNGIHRRWHGPVKPQEPWVKRNTGYV